MVQYQTLKTSVGHAWPPGFPDVMALPASLRSPIMNINFLF